MAMTRIAVITLFPEMFTALTGSGVIGRALAENKVDLRLINPRDFTSDRHRTVDDRPYGGGPGMVMMVEPLQAAIADARDWAAGEEDTCRVVYLSPQGDRFTQVLASRQVDAGNLVLICGRYEGVDQRLIDLSVDEEWSIGDYVLSGGELAAMAMIDAMVRLLPGVLGHADSAAQDSFSDGLLDCPHYTRPVNYQGHEVPAVLLSGNHKNISHWRLQQSLGRTWLKRPELLEKRELSPLESKLLKAFKDAQGDDQ